MKQSIRALIDAISRVVVNMEFEDRHDIAKSLVLVALIVVLAVLASGCASYSNPHLAKEYSARPVTCERVGRSGMRCRQ